MARIFATWLLLQLGCSLWSQQNNEDYSDWFLEPPTGNYVVGVSKIFSDISITEKNAYIDALAINELLKNGAIRANLIISRSKIADSLGLSLGSQIMLPDGVALIRQHTVGNLFCGLFSFDYGKESVDQNQSRKKKERIVAIGKQTIHPDRIYESWASAEIEALKKLSRNKKSKVQSILKKNTNKIEKLIYLQSNSNFNNARIERRWVKNKVAHVEVSDTY